MASYLGIDVGGTKVALRTEGGGAGTPAAETTFRWPEPARLTTDLEAFAKNIRACLDNWPEPVRAVGMAMPATLDHAGRVTRWPGRPGWTGLDLAGWLRTALPPVPVRFADDGDLAALAEARQAACRDLLYIGVGTGIGGGIVCDGQLLPPPARNSAEIGHVVVDRSGPRCDCGRLGCVQAMASGPATLRRAARLRGGPVTFAEFLPALAGDQPWATAAIEETGAALALIVTNVSELLSPALTVLGGGFADAIPRLAPLVTEQAQRLARPGQSLPPVQPGALAGLSSLHGAILLARDEELGRRARALPMPGSAARPGKGLPRGWPRTWQSLVSRHCRAGKR